MCNQVEQNIPEQKEGLDFNILSIRNWLDDGKWERMNGLLKKKKSPPETQMTLLQNPILLPQSYSIGRDRFMGALIEMIDDCFLSVHYHSKTILEANKHFYATRMR